MKVILRRKADPEGPRVLTGQKSSRWDFWKEGLSSSLINLWLSCREQFRLEVIEGWRADRQPLAIAFGTCMHWCLEHAYATRKVPTTQEALALVGAFEKLWNKERKQASAKQKQTQEMVYGLAEVVLPVYFQRWAGDFPDGKYPVSHNTSTPKKWEALEKRFMVPYVYPDGKKTFIVGTRDGLYRAKDGGLRVFDTKCRSIISEEDTEDTLPADIQQMLYLWTAMEETGETPSGTVMNIVRRPGHRQGKTEKLKDFFARVKKDVEKVDRWAHFFIRIEMDVTKKEILQWRRGFLDPLMWDFRMWWEGKAPHYMNPRSLISKYGRCGMFNAIQFGNFTGLYRREAGSIMKYQTEVV